MQGSERNKAIVLIDGQNLLKTAAEYHGSGALWRWHPALSRKVSSAEGKFNGSLSPTLYGDSYVGSIPGNARLLGRKIFQFERDGAPVEWRQLRYDAHAPNGREKGIDVRIALDLVRAAMMMPHSNLILFSQDSDLKEAVDEVKSAPMGARRAGRIYSAFPVSDDPAKKFRGGIIGTDWLRITRAELDACADPVEVALERAEAGASVYHADLRSKYRRNVLADYDLLAHGGPLKGKLLEIRRFSLSGMLVVELPGDVTTIRVGAHHLGRLEKRVGEVISLITRSPAGRNGFEVEDS